MWALLELIVILALILIFITEFFIPLVTNKPLFGSFRKLKARAAKSTEDGSLGEKISKAKEKVNVVKEEVRNVQDEANQHYKSAEQLKEESDNLLK